MKFHVTSENIPLGKKEFYLENEANKKVEEHADVYLLERSKQLEKLTLSSPLIPYWLLHLMRSYLVIGGMGTYLSKKS